MRATKRRAALAALPFVLGFIMASSAHAALVGAAYTPLISAGAPPDTPANRVDPNLPTSAYSGVVSINIRFAGQSFICSGTLVSKRHVVTAGHCLDTDGNGTLIDITAPGNDVRVVFNSQPNVGDPGRAIITATGVSMNPNYEGFGNCPVGVPGFCVNDDIAVVTMGADAPATANIYRLYGGTVGEGQLDYLAGYGTSGDGINGYTVGPNFRIKRRGENIMDLFDRDDESNFVLLPQEVWYSDFDGGGQDTFCNPAIVFPPVCTPILANDSETNIGGGDSGGPSFYFTGDEYQLMGNNTFGGRFPGQIPGAFGTFFGGMLINPYIGYIQSVTGGAVQIPEPGSLALLLAGLGAVGAAARRRKAK